MTMRVMLIAIAFTVTACSRPGPVTETERRAAIAGISVVLDSMNAAWRRADFMASDRPLLDEGLVTFNGHRSSVAAARARTLENPTGDFAGQYIADYTVRYDVLSRDVTVTTWQNDFARIALDGTRHPMQVALMTIVWQDTPDGWRILHYHESTQPKARETSGESLAPYTGIYQSTDGPDLQLTMAEGTLNVTVGDAQPVPLEPLTDPDFAMGNTRMTFVRNRDGTVHGVIWIRPDGSSNYAWRVSAVGGRQ